MNNREHGEQEAQDPVVVDRRVHVEDGSDGIDDNAQPSTGAQADPVEEVMQEFSEQPQDDPALVWAQKAAELQDQLLRKEADLQNMRKRHVKDMDNARRFAVESLLGDLFPALDGLAQATSGLQDTPDGENPLLDGMRSTMRIIDNAMLKHGITKISESGVPFDSELHQPLSVLDSAEVEDETVGEVFVEGYMLGETVLKPAMVQVLRPQG